MKKAKEIKDIGKKGAKELIAKFGGYVLYIWNTEKHFCELKNLTEAKDSVRIKSTGETIKLAEPTILIDGRPTWICVREFPISINLELDKDRNALIEKGYSASEIDAKLHSPYTNRIYRLKSLSRQQKIIFLVSLSLVACITSIIWIFSYGGLPNSVNNINNTNSTQSTIFQLIKIIISFIQLWRLM